MISTSNRNVGALFATSAAVHGRRDALVQGEVRLSYDALERNTNRVANAAVACGVQPGQRIAVLMKNDWRYVETVFGALRAGAVVVPVTTRSNLTTLRHVLDDAGAVGLVASPEFENEARQLVHDLHALRWLRLIGSDRPDESYERWRDDAHDTPVLLARAAQDDALLCYTSGSTGRPKGVPLSHGGIAWCAETMRRIMLLGPDERCMLAVPLFHANAATCGLWPMLACGGSLVILKDFDAAQALSALAEERCSYTTGVPAMYKLMLRQRALIDTLDLSALRFVLCSSSEVPAELLREFQQLFGVPMIEGYGLTEGGPMVLSNPRWGPRRAGTSGLPLPGVSIRVVDRDDPTRVLADGEVGELLVRSPGVTRGYRNLPELSSKRLLPGGWLRTHDLVRRDGDGYVKVVGRIDDMIICGGENVYPSEIENLLLTHPDIGDAAVVPRDDAIKGQVPVAFVVARSDTELDPKEVRDFTLREGPAWAHPRDVFVLDELPLTAAKKVDRGALSRLVRERATT